MAYSVWDMDFLGSHKYLSEISADHLYIKIFYLDAHQILSYNYVTGTKVWC